jgi:hypothetical protein
MPTESLEDVVLRRVDTPTAYSFLLEVDFYLGDHFVTENALRHSSSDIDVDVQVPSRSGAAAVHGSLRMWEYAGSLRYNFLTGAFLPYAKLGYGLTWYRLEDIRLDGVRLAEPNGPWIRKPSIFPFDNLLPNTWHWGLGVEYIIFRKMAPLAPSFSLKLDYSMYNHSLGLDIQALALQGLSTDPGIHRSVVSLLALLNF